MPSRPSRRDLLRLAGTGAAASVLAAAGFGRGAQAADEARLRLIWWGGGDRGKRTLAAVDAFKAGHPGIAVDTESTGWDAYWTKLAPQTAGGNAPDVIQMDYRYIFEYARRGALRPLDDLIPSPIDVTDYSADTLNSGKVDGRIYGLSMGLNTTGLVYDRAMIEKFKLPLPTPNWTWADLAKLAREITKAAGKRGYHGVMDGSLTEAELEIWARQHGQALYTEDGRLGFTKEIAESWFAYWADLRASGACVPADLQATDKQTIDTNLLTSGHAAIIFTNTNQLVAYQSVNKSKLGLAPQPRGEKPGEYLKPSMLMSLASTTRDPKLGAALIDFMLTRPEGAKILGLERGVPPSARIRTLLAPEVDEISRIQLEHMTLLSSRASPLPPPPPKGAGEIESVLIRKIAQEIGFGTTTPKQGAETLMHEAEAILARNRV